METFPPQKQVPVTFSLHITREKQGMETKIPASEISPYPYVYTSPVKSRVWNLEKIDDLFHHHLFKNIKITTKKFYFHFNYNFN